MSLYLTLVHLLVGLTFAPSLIYSSSSPIVQSKTGIIRGTTIVKPGSILVNQFLGVPYAQPPIGSRRFGRPQPLASDPLRAIDATKPAATCVQFPHIAEAINPLLNFDANHKVSEDCLYLNIYAPYVNESESTSSAFPVMVWLAGEGFDFADANQFDGSYLSAFGQVIVITVQYRVGVFGFLKDDIISQGNMGIWDQVEALKWIQDNVAVFGGDSKKVTVFGRFSGSMAITHLLTSPLLRNLNEPLFTKAILMSGVAVDEWTMEKAPLERSNSFIHALGCDQLNASKCLYFASSDEILSKSGYGWKPTIDNVLITDGPFAALSRGEIAKGVESVMIGSTASEGSLCLLTWMVTKRNIYNKLISGDITEQQMISLAKKDLKTYTTGNGDAVFQSFIKSRTLKSGIPLAREYVNFCSNLLINSHSERLASILNTLDIETSSYKLHYKPGFSLAPDFIETGSHGDDVLLAFGLPFNSPSEADERDLSVSSSLLSLISSFAWSIDLSTVSSAPNGDLIISRRPSPSKLTLNAPLCNGTSIPNSCSMKKTLSTFINMLDSKPSVKTSIPNYSS